MKKHRFLACLLLAIYGLLPGQCQGQLTLSVNRVNGSASISHDASIDLTGYSVVSDNGLLNPDWQSLTSQSISGWSVANPKATGVGELNVSDATTLTVGTTLDLNGLFTTGGSRLDEDLRFSVSTLGGDFLEGAVEYIGQNPTLLVDRATGNASLRNDFGSIGMTGYSIRSDNGLLALDGWNSLQDQSVLGWSEANPKATIVGELNPGSHSDLLGGSDGLSLGSLFAVGARPQAEDATFQISTTDGQFLEGIVQYEGPVNDVVLRINPDNGEGQLEMLSSVAEFDVTGYSILSESGSLSTDWQSLQDGNVPGWAEANPKKTALGELNVSNSTVFSTGTVLSLGTVWESSVERDLVFNYTTKEGEFLAGTVEFGVGANVPPAFLAADFNQNGSVDFPDFLLLSSQFGQSVDPAGTAPDINGSGVVDFPDFLILSSTFGQSSAAAASVPEPGCVTLLAMGGLCLGPMRRKRRG